MSKIQWLTDPDVKPGLLGDLPRGFVYSDGVSPGLTCGETSPAYVRGILLPTGTYNALSFDQRVQLREPNVYPRWHLYGGPFSLKYVAEQWDDYMVFWAFDHNLTWVSHRTGCIVPEYLLAWPADKSMRWDWVYEKTYPKTASRKWDGSKYVLTFSSVAGVPSPGGADEAAALAQPAPVSGDEASTAEVPKKQVTVPEIKLVQTFQNAYTGE